MITLLIPITDIKGSTNQKHLENLLNSIELGGYLPEVGVLGLFDATSEDFFTFFRERCTWLKCMYNTGNRLLFTKNVNVGIRWVLQNQPDNDIILVNQDTILPDWQYLKLIQGEGISSPSSTNIPDRDKLNELNGKEVKRNKVNNVPFYCTYINSQVIKKIGLLDACMKTTCSDEDMCLRAKLAGFEVEAVDGVSIYHAGTHIDVKPGWESPSGSYDAELLTKEVKQMLTKYQCTTDHAGFFNWVLQNYSWDGSLFVE